jgi:DNA-binding NtrC family response regulator
VLFPVADDPSLPASEEISEMPGGTERILFVDDEQSIVGIGKELLTRLGYTVETRVDSRDCLEAFRARPDGYDLVITDYAMPGMDGEELIKEIRKIRHNIPVILCTGFSTSILSNKLSVPGIDCMLMKPITASELAIAVRRALDSR